MNKPSSIITFAFLSSCVFFGACASGTDNSGNVSVSQNKETKPELIEHVENLDNMLPETSGLICYDGKFWTINDSGSDPVLFSVDMQTGKVLQSVELKNGINKDWESLAQDEQYIYICDVGNNYGRREVLHIYKLSKDSIPVSGSVSVNAEIITYSYAGRGNNYPIKRSAYDCEAAFAFGDSIYLFTKNWVAMTTTLYTCSKTPGSHVVHARKTYPVDGLITGADMSSDSSFVVLCGYKDYVPFIWFFKNFKPADYSYSTALRFDYPSYINLQSEGIAVYSPERVFISSEMTEFPAALHRIDLRPYMK